MEHLAFHLSAKTRAGGEERIAIIGVVASGNLEVLVERDEAELECQVVVNTAVTGFGEVWRAVAEDFVERYSPGGLKFSINDGGARPDTVMLRLAQAVRLITGESR